MEGLGADVIGLNCGLGPIQLLPFLKDMVRVSSTPILVNPNAGLPSEGGKTVYDINADEFAEAMKEMARNGATVLEAAAERRRSTFTRQNLSATRSRSVRSQIKDGP